VSRRTYGASTSGTRERRCASHQSSRPGDARSFTENAADELARQRGAAELTVELRGRGEVERPSRGLGVSVPTREPRSALDRSARPRREMTGGASAGGGHSHGLSPLLGEDLASQGVKT